MNTFGSLFRVSIFGESHGPAIGVVVDGCPAGAQLSASDFEADMARRRSGASGTTPRKESDEVLIKSGVFNGRTTGAPVLLMILNQDIRPSDYEKLKDTPRPGHSDWAAQQKFGGSNDYRGGGHFSGRLTAALVSAGVLAKKAAEPVSFSASLLEAGGRTEIDAAVQEALQAGDSVGGVVECRVGSIPAGLGEPFFDSLESLLAHALFAIPAVKGVEFGAGFRAAAMRGSECNDPILDAAGRTATNNSGGINGGISNGNELVFRVAIKPTSSIAKAGQTVDLKTGRPAEISVHGRHDACIALRVPVVVEAAAALVVADLMLRAQKVKRVKE